MKRLLVALLLVIGAAAAQAQTVAKPLMLVAAPDLQGFYSRTALIVIPVGPTHVGFIMNRATGYRMGALFPDHGPSAKVADPIHFGGPEMSDALFAVVRRDPGGDAVPLFDGLYFTGDREAIDRVIEQTPLEARFFAGFVGWQPGELAQEIDAGYWYVAEPDATLFFRADTTALWDELVARLGSGHKPQRRGFFGASL
jgi:putative transcriptional regulator